MEPTVKCSHTRNHDESVPILVRLQATLRVTHETQEA